MAAITAEEHDHFVCEMLENNPSNYESSGEDCKFDNRYKIQNRGPYLEDNCQYNNVIEKTIVNIWQYLDKSEKCYFWTIVS